jgi:hypothetical protein
MHVNITLLYLLSFILFKVIIIIVDRISTFDVIKDYYIKGSYKYFWLSIIIIVVNNILMTYGKLIFN